MTDGLHRDLGRLLRPSRVAVVGGNWAEAVVRQCRLGGFGGSIWPVNPRRRNMAGVACFENLDALPGAPDAVFLGVNRDLAPDALARLNELGAGGVICFASGFAETGDLDRQEALIAAAGEMPLLGPNCYGILNYLDGIALWPDQHGGRKVERGVGIISSSSNIAINLTMQRRGLPIAMVACVGNQAQTTMADVAMAMLDDPRVTALGFYIEGVRDAVQFATMAEAAERRRIPIVAIKSGRSPGAARAIESHTAMLSGRGAASSAFLRRCGVGEVETLGELVETLKLLHLSGPLPGRRIASLSCSGGEAGLVADHGAAFDLTWPQPDATMRKDLAAVLGPLVTVNNPLDYQTFIWGDPVRMEAVFTTMMAGPYDLTMLVMDSPHAQRCDRKAWLPTIAAWKAGVARTNARTAVVTSLSDNMTETDADEWMAAGVVPFFDLRDALTATETAAGCQELPLAGWRPWVRNPASRVRMLTEDVGKALLRSADIAVPRGVSGPTIGALAELAIPFAGPGVLKGLGLAHKSERDAVRLGVEPGGLGEAVPMDGVTGYLFEEMIGDGVAEILLSVSCDPVYGFAVTLGMGGVMAELLKDTVTLIAPVSDADVTRALGNLRLAPLLNGYRGAPSADVDAVAEVVGKLLAVVESDPAFVEIEINPLIVRAAGQGAVAVDVLIQEDISHAQAK